MTILKRIEVGIRRFLLKTLRFIVRRGAPRPDQYDFNLSSVLFVRQDRIGDVLVSTPLIRILKRHYPGIQIDFLLSTNNYFVLENEPLVRKRWIYRKTLWSAMDVLLNIRRERYEYVVDLMDNPSTTSTVVCALSGARWTVGLQKENAYAYDLTVPLLSRKESHIVERLAQLLTAFGIDPSKEDLSLHYHVSQTSRERAQHFFRNHQIEGKEVVGVNISPARGVRFWGREHFRSFIRGLIEKKPDAHILLLFQPSDEAEAREIARPFPTVVLSPRTNSFDHFAALVERVNYLLTPDTSAVHLAAAFRIPCVVLYVQSNKQLRIWEPYGTPCETLVTDVDDLTQISPQAALRAFERLMTSHSVNGASPVVHRSEVG
jgi:ADP-heptose:LPS heptosyltransferase